MHTDRQDKQQWCCFIVSYNLQRCVSVFCHITMTDWLMRWTYAVAKEAVPFFLILLRLRFGCFLIYFVLIKTTTIDDDNKISAPSNDHHIWTNVDIHVPLVLSNAYWIHIIQLTGLTDSCVAKVLQRGIPEVVTPSKWYYKMKTMQQ